MRLLKITGVVTAALAAIALAVAYAPGVAGQVKVRPTPKAKAFMETFAGGSHIGVSIRDLDDADVKREKLGTTAGVVIDEVMSESPAARAGLKAGDVVVEFDGEKVRGSRQFARLVDETPEGRSVKLGVVRDGQRVAVDVTPEAGGAEWAWREPFERLRMELPRMPTIDLPAFEVHTLMRSTRLGIRTEALTPQLADYFGVKRGVLVTTVDDGSVAAKAGLKAGDVITAVNGTAVDDPADLQRGLRAGEDDGQVSIEIVRDRKPQTLTAKVEPRTRPRALRRRVTDF